MRWLDPSILWLLVAVFLLAIGLVWAIAIKGRLLRRFGDRDLLQRISPGISLGRQRIKVLLASLALACIVLALARLQFGTHQERVTREGLDIVVALDCSISMLAEDMPPNRLELAKNEIRGIIDRLRGDRIGLVAFAGEAFVQCPLTLDYSAAELLLSVMDNRAVAVQGTDLGEAIRVSRQAMTEDEETHKVLLLLTDGEDHGNQALAEAEKAANDDIRIYAVGIGSPTGVPIPERDRTGEQLGFLKNRETGDVVVSRLDEETLRQITRTTGGAYYPATAGELGLDRIFEDIQGLETTEFEGELITRYEDRFQWLVLIALILMVTEFLLPERRRRRKKEQYAVTPY